MKDKNNLTTYNVWSGTDYLKNTQNFSNGNGLKISSSNSFSSNGENSLKIIRDADSGFYLDMPSLSGVEGTLTFKCYIYSPESDITITFRTNNGEVSRTVFPSSNIFEEIILSCIIPDDYTYIFVRLLPRSKSISFIDNVKLIIP